VNLFEAKDFKILSIVGDSGFNPAEVIESGVDNCFGGNLNSAVGMVDIGIGLILRTRLDLMLYTVILRSAWLSFKNKVQSLFLNDHLKLSNFPSRTARAPLALIIS
jgi:hypothetical protein